MKRILTIQDISCIGKCSCTVALPVISLLGSETCILPTSLLSTHSGIKGFTFLDLGDYTEKIFKHWYSMNFSFDAVYTGYLGSKVQVENAMEAIDKFGQGKPVIVDPAMADNGKLYSGISQDTVDSMIDLCTKANIITPNITEASIISNTEYKNSYTEKEINSMLLKLADMGPEYVVISGVDIGDNTLDTAIYSKEQDKIEHIYDKKIEGIFHGTGDLFASCMVGMLMRDESISDSVRVSCEFVKRCIESSVSDDNFNSYGVNFEKALPWLAEQIK